MTTALQSHFDAYKGLGGMIGTSVSALFLFAIAAANILVLVQVYRAFQTVKAGGRLVEADIDGFYPGAACSGASSARRSG